MAHIDDVRYSAAPSQERRGSPRLQVLGKLHGNVVPIGLPVTVVDIGLGGFAIKTSVAFPIGAVHQFRLTLGDDTPVVVAGRVAYCRLDDSQTPGTVYLTGFAFVEAESQSGTPTAADLVDRVALALSFDVQ